MRKLRILSLLAVCVALGAGPAFADEVVEAANREKARQEALKKKRDKARGRAGTEQDKPRVLGNEDLKRAGENASVSEVTPHHAAGEKPASAPAADGQDSVWRARVEDAEKGVGTARKRVEELRLELSEQRRLVSATDDPNLRLQAESKLRQAESDIPKAEQAVRDAEKDALQVREEARKAGVAPGALR